MTTPFPTHMLFLDLETTGLTSSDTILVAAARLVRVGDLEPVGRVVHMILPLDRDTAVDAIRAWEDPVRSMHSKSGLLDAVVLAVADGPQAHDDEPSIGTLLGLDNQLRNLIANELDAHDARVPLAGYGVSHMEAKGWIEKHLPQTYRHLEYWPLDVSVLRRCLQAFGFQVEPKGDDHRALLDVDRALQDFRNYKSMLRASNLDSYMGLASGPPWEPVVEEPF